MTEPRPVQTGEPSQDSQRPKKGRVLILRVVLPAMIIFLAVIVSRHLTQTRPKAQKRPAQPMETLVTTEIVHPTDERVVIEAMGTVIPAREIVLKARVPGQIIWVSEHFIDGGLLRKGDELLKLDPADYEIDIVRAQAELARAKYDLQLENGQQKVAQREWELLDAGQSATDAERKLALREPHQERVRASLQAAEANLSQAQLNAERTIVRSPFNAVIKHRETELGEQVSTQDALATLVDTDVYWVQASVPMDRLAWLNIPIREGEEGSHARISVGAGNGASTVYTGQVIRLLSDLEEVGRMARILIEIRDPLSLSGTPSPPTPLLLGSYTRVELDGDILQKVIRISRAMLHENAKVWIATPIDTLEIRSAGVAWRGSDYVLIHSGLEAGDRLIISDLAAPVPGMKLEIDHGDDTATRTGDDVD